MTRRLLILEKGRVIADVGHAFAAPLWKLPRGMLERGRESMQPLIKQPLLS
jgi:hypothetical protein